MILAKMDKHTGVKDKLGIREKAEPLPLGTGKRMGKRSNLVQGRLSAARLLWLMESVLVNEAT